MQIKEIKPINFLYFRKATTVPELGEMIPFTQELYKEAVGQSLKITGAVHWHYMEIQDMVKPFTLEVSLPIAEVQKDYDGRFHFKRTELYKCVSVFHEGSYDSLPNVYDSIFEYVMKNKLQPTTFNREIYINVDFSDPTACFTEVQIGIH